MSAKKFTDKLILAFAAWVESRSYSQVLKLGKGIGWVWSRLFPLRKKLVIQNLKSSFPENSAGWYRDTANACLTHFATVVLELLWLRNIDQEFINDRVSIQGFDVLERLASQGRGMIAVGCHFGNWELMGAVVSGLGIPISYIVKKMHNPVVDELINELRMVHDVRIIYTKESRKLLKTFRDGRVVAILSDQDARKRGVFVPFFNRSASTPKGAAAYALRLGIPLVLAHSKRESGGRYNLEFMEIKIESHWQADEDGIRELTARFTEIFEDRIRKTPEQWFWMHRRWKTKPV
jgi:Kdo2-lipid IVA lauroyltransferase/acyltransferase